MTVHEQDHLPALLKRLQGTDGAAARRLLEQAAQAYPADPRLLLLLAAELVHAKELDRAEAAYTAALQLAPDFAIARFQLGLLQLTSARPAVARATWAPLGGLPESHPLRLFKSGLELLVQDRFDEARASLEKGIAANRDNPALNRDMQLVLARIAETTSGTGASPSDGPAAPDQAEGHVLVSTYRNTR